MQSPWIPPQGHLGLIGTTLTTTALEYIMTGSESRLEMFSVDTDHTRAGKYMF